VRELDYIPVRASRQSRHVQTHVIGVVFDEIDAATDFWGLMTLRGLREGALQFGYDLLLMLRPAPQWAEGREETQYLDRRSDGLIFVAPNNRHDLLASLVRRQIPVVACHDTDVPRGVAHVVADNTGAARMATEYLISKGHTRIAYLPGNLGKSYFQHRRDGFIKAMTAAKLNPNFVMENSGWLEGGGAREVLAGLQKGKASAVVCANDSVAFKLWDAARENKLRVPQ